MNLWGLEITTGQLALGVVAGMTYGILGVGLVLVHRSSRLINFAHGEIGAFGAVVGALLVVRWNVPYWLAFGVALAVAALVGAGTEVVVVRRLRAAPKLMGLVATLGLAQVLLLSSRLVNSTAPSRSSFPTPTGLPEFRIGTALITSSYSAMLLLTPLVVVALTLFLRFSSYGLAMRAAAANADRARMVGVSASRMSTLSWAIAGMLAGFTVMLILPTRGTVSAEVLGPVLLLRALAPAVLARLQSLPIALFAGLGIGVFDQLMLFNFPTSGITEFVLLGVILIALLAQRRSGGRAHEREDWARLRPWSALDERLQSVWSIRNLGRITAAVCLAAAIVVGSLATSSTSVTLVTIVAFSLIGVSMGVLTGLSGQLSLGHFAIAGVGAIASLSVAESTGNFLLALLAAAACGGAVSLVLGLPALRVQGPLLAIVTLGFALAASRWLFGQDWALGSGVTPRRPVLGPLSLATTQQYYFWALSVFVVAFWFARNVWRGGIGLRLRACRDNEDALRAFGIAPTRVKLQGFVLSGCLAGVGGSVYGHLLSRVGPTTFDVVTSFNIAAMTVLGGIGLLAGPLLGAAYIVGVPRFLPLDNAGLAATSAGWLILIMYFPGGLAQLIAVPRRAVIDRLARRAGIDPCGDEDAERTSVSFADVHLPGRLGSERGRAGSGRDADTSELLRARGLAKRYGGVTAVAGVDLHLSDGEILGILGPNGAGKTTLFELLSGFSLPDEGTVQFGGHDVTRMPAHRRTRLGMVRSFQDAALFPSLTVLETVSLSLERAAPTRALLSVMGVQRLERDRTEHARALLATMGLDRYRHRQIRELSTGTRRITELACLAALQPSVLLLDEPSSGIAQRESEALGDVIIAMKQRLGCSIVVIEHDVPLLMGLSTRVMAMDAGRVIAVGSPGEIRNHPEVVESYLGGDSVAIDRSGAVGGQSTVGLLAEVRTGGTL